MTPEKKKNRRLRNYVLLSLLLLLIGGTYAFTAFNQRAINDRENQIEINVGGRVHDYYNRDTENKDVFVENYGERPIMARIRLTEFLETRQTGQDSWTQLVAGTERNNLDSWTTWMPNATNINDRLNTDPSNAFDRYARLTFGWSREGRDAPWYMPTFNHDNMDQMTAAAGHARDYIAGGGATDGTTDGATHPGDGTDDYWSETDSFDNTAGTWPGETITNDAAQNLHQQRAPMTIEQWAQLQPYQQIGDFWVVDHQTGWAYWASLLEPGEATSYLLDAAEMTAAIEDTVFNGSYYYGIHVESGLVSPDNSDDFLPDGHDRLADFLTGIRNNAMDGEGSNPRADIDSPPSAFNFGAMLPGRVFTMSGQQYRYLEDMGNGNHMIIRNNAIRNVSWNDQEAELTSWYSILDSAVQDIVQPISNNFTTGEVAHASVNFTGGPSWLPTNLTGPVADDVTQVVPAGTARAFALSLADVTRLSGEGLAFPYHAQRASAASSWWWLRTPVPNMQAWLVGTNGHLIGGHARTNSYDNGGVRPALIINQPTS
ncbi:DUF6273 domain-containing protein [Lactococcus garvieae]|uniref:DUF6273 domain-containing protein n=1 Tax=Lactococcus garvieae TaxID=1363 RepID=UPI0018D65189|nr:DUF6273 domain-containing protein [Lactococcus garvieae]QPS70756.1 hypothetical protein I6G50_08430 [Lactococcus garvieae]